MSEDLRDVERMQRYADLIKRQAAMSGVERRRGVMELLDSDAYRLATGITRLRKHRGLSMTDVANELGVDPSSVSYWESGARTPSATLLIELHRLLGGEWTDLLG